MPAYLLSGMHTDRRASLRTGAIATITALAVTAGAVAWNGHDDADGLRFSVMTTLVGDGVSPGSAVTVDGVRVGTVATVENTGRGVQQLTLQLNDAATKGLTTGLSMSYTPSNLFGITAVALERGTNAAPLRAGSVIDLTGKERGRVLDATLGSILRRSSSTSEAMLTPRLAELITRLSSDLRAFTPFLQSAVSLAQTTVNNRTMSTASFLDRLGSATESTSVLFDATVQVIDRVYLIDVLRTDRARIGLGLDIVTSRLFPTMGATMRNAGANFGEFIALLVPTLTAIANTVSTPRQSGAELGELIGRLRSAMPNTPGGPVLNVEATLVGVPAVSQTLLAPTKRGRR